MIPRLRGAGRGAAVPPAAPGAAASGVAAAVGAGLAMVIGVGVCIAVAPKPVDVNEGLSWFGVTRATVVPYALTMLATAALLLRTSRALAPLTALQPLRRALAAGAVLLPLLVATPFTLNTLVDDAHMTLGSALFVIQLLAVGRLWLRSRDRLIGVLLAVQFGAGLVCAASLPDLVEGMLQAQLLFQAAFTVAVVRGVLLLAPDHAEGSMNSTRLPKGSSA